MAADQLFLLRSHYRDIAASDCIAVFDFIGGARLGSSSVSLRFRLMANLLGSAEVRGISRRYPRRDFGGRLVLLVAITAPYHEIGLTNR